MNELILIDANKCKRASDLLTANEFENNIVLSGIEVHYDEVERACELLASEGIVHSVGGFEL